jgi:hypothetical protein
MLVEVEDVNEPPVIPAAVTIPENTELDPDLIFDPEGDDFNLVINSGDNLQDPNAVDSDDFIVFNNENLSFAPDVAPPDFENPTDEDTNNVYLVEVTATETTGDERTVTGTVEITVEDVNEPPVFEGAPFEFTITDPQGATDGTEVGTVVATDPDEAGADVTFEITDGNDPDDNGTGAFAINDDGVITVANANELPEEGVFNLTVGATETTNPSDDSPSTEEVTINVGRVGDIDIDDDEDVTGPIDGILIARQLFGFFNISPDTLVDGIPFNDNSQVTDPNAINEDINGLIESSIG